MWAGQKAGAGGFAGCLFASRPASAFALQLAPALICSILTSPVALALQALASQVTSLAFQPLAIATGLCCRCHSGLLWDKIGVTIRATSARINMHVQYSVYTDSMKNMQ
jgi:hypothetical protein